MAQIKLDVVNYENCTSNFGKVHCSSKICNCTKGIYVAKKLRKIAEHHFDYVYTLIKRRHT